VSAPADTVVLLDVDNTLLDNDQVERDLHRHLRETFGAGSEERYWALFEQLRSELGYADYLGTLQRYRLERDSDPRLLRMSLFLVEYPFPERLYPGVPELLAALRARTRTVILSDGDAVFQPLKVCRSGLWDAVSGDVLIYIHKELKLEDVERRYPARRYVMVDDKVRILAAMKRVWGDRLTTVFVRQGHYADDRDEVARHPAADVTIERIGDLLDWSTRTGLGRP